MLSPQIRGDAIWWMRTKAKGRHGVVCRLNCVIHVWAPWGRDTCRLGHYINPRTFIFTFSVDFGMNQSKLAVVLWGLPWLLEVGQFHHLWSYDVWRDRNLYIIIIYIIPFADIDMISLFLTQNIVDIDILCCHLIYFIIARILVNDVSVIP